MFILAAVSQDAIFGAVITVGLATIGAFVPLFIRSSSNGEAIKRIEDSLDKHDLPEIESRVDDLWRDRQATWDFLRHRGDAEAEQKGFGRKRSPMELVGPDAERTMAAFLPMMMELLAVEKECGCDALRDHDEPALWQAIAARMSLRLKNEICPVLGIYEGGCVSLAIASMRAHKRKP